jgi:hypothetical protein
MKITAVFGLTFLTSLPLAFAQESDEANAILQTERDLAAAYQRSDADAIAQGVMEDYTLTNSTGKITTRADDIAEAKKNDPKYEIFEKLRHESVRPWRHRSCHGQDAHKRNLRRETVRFPVSIYGHFRQRRRTLAFARRSRLKAAGERKVDHDKMRSVFDVRTSPCPSAVSPSSKGYHDPGVHLTGL